MNPDERHFGEATRRFSRQQSGIEGLAWTKDSRSARKLARSNMLKITALGLDEQGDHPRSARATEAGPYGIALDVGTTTLALYLCNLETGKILTSASATNPQTIFGEDIMSRISYSVHHPERGCQENAKRTDQLRSTTMIRQVTDDKRVSTDDIVDMTVVGNTVMHHIFLGLPPDRLGYWPFTPTVENSVNIKARDLGLDILPAAYVHVLPVEAGFVGADNVAVLIAEEPYKRDEFSLVIDIGTNGELVLGQQIEPSLLLVRNRPCPGRCRDQVRDESCARSHREGEDRVRRRFEVDYKVIGNETWKSDRGPANSSLSASAAPASSMR